MEKSRKVCHAPFVSGNCKREKENVLQELRKMLDDEPSCTFEQDIRGSRLIFDYCKSH